MKSLLRRIAYRSLVPAAMRANWLRLRHAGDRAALRSALVQHYFAQPLNHFGGTMNQYLATGEGRSDMDNHLEGRLQYDREWVMPWLNAAHPLKDARVLEIGCGTGASTVALAEQGAIVTAIDINANNLEAARKRCELYGLRAKFDVCNATEIAQRYARSQFDFIIFFATLEHLTYPERLSAMRSTWAMLAPSGLWCVVETPNRLSPVDDHTTCLPFGHWLPDDLLLDYAGRSERAFMRAYEHAPRDEDTLLDLARRGRGASYHEFDLTLGRQIDVVSARDPYVRSINLANRLKWRFSQARKDAQFLQSHGPKIHEGFYQPYLDLIIRKGST
jgi:2-polyprenyl-3-methyl-5-hydroxy-6-metoxy-1,4-benzoquinol methylase